MREGGWDGALRRELQAHGLVIWPSVSTDLHRKLHVMTMLGLLCRFSYSRLKILVIADEDVGVAILKDE